MSTYNLSSARAHIAALEARIIALEGLKSAPAVAPVTPAATVAVKAPRTDTCSCGAVYGMARLVSEVAASPMGLCGLKNKTAHKGA